MNLISTLLRPGVNPAASLGNTKILFISKPANIAPENFKKSPREHSQGLNITPKNQMKTTLPKEERVINHAGKPKRLAAPPNLSKLPA